MRCMQRTENHSLSGPLSRLPAPSARPGGVSVLWGEHSVGYAMQSLGWGEKGFSGSGEDCVSVHRRTHNHHYV